MTMMSTSGTAPSLRERAKTSGVIDIDYAFLSLLQAIWARDYWFTKVGGLVR
jgi:hypothetical protein